MTKRKWNQKLLSPNTIRANCDGGGRETQKSFWYPCFGFLVASALGFKGRVDPLTSVLCHLCTMNPQIHLWWDTCWSSWWPAWQPSLFELLTISSIGGTQINPIMWGRHVSFRVSEFYFFVDRPWLLCCSKISYVKITVCRFIISDVHNIGVFRNSRLWYYWNFRMRISLGKKFEYKFRFIKGLLNSN